MAFAEPPGWYVISLRPQGQHGALRRAAAAHGAGLIAVSPWRLELAADPATRMALDAALAAPRVVFTSPMAVRAAARHRTLHCAPGQRWIAVGSGTAAVLRRAGVHEVDWPSRMDSEGVLGLPGLAALDGAEIGLVTAPEGRDLLALSLHQRGARVLRADVYRRVPVPLSTRVLYRLRQLDAPACLALTSEAALRRTLAALPDDLAPVLLGLPAAAASERLQRCALDLGMRQVDVAEGPLPAQLLAVMSRRFR